MVVKKYLKDYVEDGRYTIVVAPSMKSLLFLIEMLYPTARVITSDADAIGGKKLLVDKWSADGLGLKAALPKYREEDIVYEHFTRQFVEGDKASGESTVNECEELPKISKEVREATGLIENIIAHLESIKADVIKGTALIDRINVDNTFENDGSYNMNIDIDFKSNLKSGE